MIPVKVVAQQELHGRVVETIKLVNSTQRHFRLSLDSSPPDRWSETSGVMHPVGILGELTSSFPEQHVVLILSNPFADNWFSHEGSRAAVITTHGWEPHFAPPSLRAYLIYQLAQALLGFAADLTEEMSMNMVHDPPRGCMMDLCVHKPDIKLGMVSGWLCLGCEGHLRQLGTPVEAINAVERVLSLVRDEAIGKPRLFDPSTAFVVMRFSKNDENHHAYLYGIKPGLEDAGLTVVRADDRVESGQLLDKILRQLDRSRFVVAKVDENNLNVFFELGLALGGQKEVLLVSEQELVLQLPSDLRNWECLTYPRGDYETLRHRVKEYFLPLR